MEITAAQEAEIIQQFRKLSATELAKAGERMLQQHRDGVVIAFTGRLSISDGLVMIITDMLNRAASQTLTSQCSPGYISRKYMVLLLVL